MTARRQSTLRYYSIFDRLHIVSLYARGEKLVVIQALFPGLSGQTIRRIVAEFAGVVRPRGRAPLPGGPKRVRKAKCAA